MASVSKTGRTWRVRWLQGGRSGAWQSERFGNRETAEAFARLVAEAGNAWPEGWVKGRGRVGDVITGLPKAGADPRATQTVAEWCLAFHRGRPVDSVTPETRKRLIRHVELYVAPHRLGSLPLHAVVADDVRGWLADLAADGYSYKSLRNWRGELATPLRAATEAGLIVRYPMGKDVPVPITKSGRPAYFAKPWECADLITAAPDVHGGKLVIRTLLATGLRWGELRALRARSVSTDAFGITLEIFTARKHSPDGEHRFAEPKTRAGKRTIAVADDLGAELWTLARGKRPADLLFDLPADGTFWRQVWHPATVGAGLDEVWTDPATGKSYGMRQHDCRHTHASDLLARGATLFDVSRRLGHETQEITANLYGHMASDNGRLRGVLNGTATPEPSPVLRLVAGS